jgi:hypothetical protein
VLKDFQVSSFNKEIVVIKFITQFICLSLLSELSQDVSLFESARSRQL